MPQTDPSHPEIESFFHKDTGTWTHVVHDGEAAAVIDPVLDYDAAAARTSTTSADAVLAFVQQRALRIEWILETHAHADHLSAAGYLHDGLDAPIAIGRGIVIRPRYPTRPKALSAIRTSSPVKSVART